MGQMRTVAQSVQDQHLDPVQQLETFLGNHIAIGYIRETAEAIAVYFEITMPDRYRDHFLTEQREVSLHLDELELRLAASGLAFPGPIAEGAGPPPQCPRRAVARERRALAEVEDAHFVEAEHVIGMGVGEDHRVHPRQTEAQGLLAQVGRRVDEHHLAVLLQLEARPPALVPRVLGHADGAGDTDHRPPRGGGAAQHGDAERQGARSLAAGRAPGAGAEGRLGPKSAHFTLTRERGYPPSY